MVDTFKRIQNASEQELRTVLANLCRASDNTRRKAAELFDQCERASNVQTVGKMPPATLYICLNCEDEFEEAWNGPKACCYHPGK